MKLKEKIAIKYIRTKFKVLSAVSKKKAAKEALKLFTTPQKRSIKKLPRIFLEAEPIHFLLEKIKIKGFRWNKDGTKRILILHGYESTVLNFDAYIKPLIDKGYEVLAFDAPAHGYSGGETITVIIYKNMIKAINELYGEVKGYIAHSFGGLAVSLAMEELKHDESFKLVLIAPAAETQTALDNYSSLLKLTGEVKMELSLAIGRIAANPIEWYSISRVAENIKAQMRFYQDEEDLQTPIKDIIKIKMKNLPNTEFFFSKGLGHNKIYRDAGVRKSIVDFL